MKNIKFLPIIAIALISALANQTSHSMQKPALTQADITTFSMSDFNPERDMPGVTEIFKSDWEKIFIGRPFDQEIVNRLMILVDTDPNAKKILKVLRHNNATIGFATYYFFEQRTPKEGCLGVGGLVVHLRSQGLARHFFPFILKDLEQMGAECLSVLVKKDNVIAKNLYEKFGFKIIEENAIGNTSFKLVKKLKTAVIEEQTK